MQRAHRTWHVFFVKRTLNSSQKIEQQFKRVSTFHGYFHTFICCDLYIIKYDMTYLWVIKCDSVFPISSHFNPMFFPRKPLFLLTFPAQPSVNQRRQAPPAAILSALNATIGRALERKLREVAEHHGGEAAKIIENHGVDGLDFPKKCDLVKIC